MCYIPYFGVDDNNTCTSRRAGFWRKWFEAESFLKNSIYESFYKNEGIWGKNCKKKNNTIYFDSFIFLSQLLPT